MRAGVVVVGAVLLVLGMAAGVLGAPMREVRDACVAAPECDKEDGLVIGAVGDALFFGGALLGLAGIGLLVAGVVAEPRPRVVAVQVDAGGPKCPACGAAPAGAKRYCSACGTPLAAVAVTAP